MVQRITIAPQGPEFSRFVMGYWRLMDWNMSARQLVSFNDDYFQPLRDELAVVAEELNAGSIEQVVYAWVLRLPSQPLPIIGSGKIERVRAAVEAETLKMTRQQWFRIRKAALGYDVP
ncbi:aldo/keto reductase [Escherichia coli]|nr:aldo/keto reductase [Escherichia coli]EFF0662507.1 hypothetical protein [Escherichia coli]EFK4033579.1 hypothetical protein [Escherichia coli]EHW2685773.1 aldo/keto reductase [Escherichia coli]EHX9307917.1 aldo/keto reductase [Escherichia coli]